MIKLITPPGMLLTVALLIVYSAYAFLIGLIEDSWILLAGGVVSVVATYGTAMLKPWSRFLVYFLTAGFLVKLGSSMYAGISSGYFDLHFESASEGLRSLVPGTMMALLSCACCYLVFRHFNPASTSTHPASAQRMDTDSTGGPSLLDKQVPSELLWMTATIAAVLLGHWLQSRVHLNHDVSWIGHSARWLLEGRSFGSGILDVNPPMAWFLSLPAAVIANTGLVTEPLAIRLVFWGYFLLAAIATAHALAGGRKAASAAAMGWRAAFIIVATLAPAASFGQREYVSVLFAMPYLAAAAARMDGGNVLTGRAAAAIGLLAGLGFAIKPYFLAVPFLVEGLLAVRLGWRSVFRTESLVMAASIAAYVLFVVVFMAEYLRTSVPMAQTFYWAYDSGSLEVVLRRFGVVSQPAVFGAIIAIVTRSWTAHHSVVLLAALGYSISYSIQAKGFVHHAYPVLLCSFVLLGICLASGLSQLSRRMRTVPRPFRVGVAACLILAALLPTKIAHDNVAAWFFTYHVQWGKAGRFRQAVIDAVNQHAPSAGSSFFAFSTHPFPAFPTGSYTVAEWAGRSPTQGVIAALARLDEVSDPELRRRIIDTAEMQRIMVIEDLTRRPPSIVFVDAARARLGLHGRAFDDLEFYSQDARFKEFWKSYKEISRIGSLRVFVRGDL